MTGRTSPGQAAEFSRKSELMALFWPRRILDAL